MYTVDKSVPASFRKYPFSSERIISISELEKYSKTELNIMRNEIFANYGYRFKSQKWKDYFDTIPEYIPHYSNVNDKVTVIEKINIQRILKVAPIK